MLCIQVNIHISAINFMNLILALDVITSSDITKTFWPNGSFKAFGEKIEFSKAL